MFMTTRLPARVQLGELISRRQINEAYERLMKSDVKYRFVIDMASLA
jgi:D-arabinose 1-dehydrogenase-like Zn-dependent alcohol dehydrogenase